MQQIKLKYAHRSERVKGVVWIIEGRFPYRARRVRPLLCPCSHWYFVYIHITPIAHQRTAAAVFSQHSPEKLCRQAAKLKPNEAVSHTPIHASGNPVEYVRKHVFKVIDFC